MSRGRSRVSHNHTHTYKLQKDQGHHSQELYNSMQIKKVMEKLLLNVMGKNEGCEGLRKWACSTGIKGDMCENK